MPGPARDRLIPLIRLRGIAIVADPSWFLQLGLLTLVARYTLLQPVHGSDTGAGPWIASVGLALAIVGCIVVHELAHCFVARGYRLPVRRIVLFLFGGVSQIEREAPHARAEFAIAVAGPMASVVLATLLAGVAGMLDRTTVAGAGLWGWFARINMVLAVFNLLPAFPMDGGRILRSLLWAGTRNRAGATRWAARVGKGFATAMALLGGALVVVPAVRGGASDPSQGIWLVLLGFFLYNAAGAAARAEGGTHPTGNDAGREH